MGLYGISFVWTGKNEDNAKVTRTTAANMWGLAVFWPTRVIVGIKQAFVTDGGKSLRHNKASPR